MVWYYNSHVDRSWVCLDIYPTICGERRYQYGIFCPCMLMTTTETNDWEHKSESFWPMIIFMI
jgi:hypothetical protein